MRSGREPDRLRLVLPPATTSPRLARLFVAQTLDTLGVEERTLDDLRVVVSDIATTLVRAGRQIEIEVEVEADSGHVVVGGNRVDRGDPPARLLGDALTEGGMGWQVRLPTR